MAKFYFKCPQCGMPIAADDSVQGQVAECPSCKKGIVVPFRPPSDSVKTQRIQAVPTRPTDSQGPDLAEKQVIQSTVVATPVRQRNNSPECWSLALSLAALAIGIVTLFFSIPVTFGLQAGLGFAFVAMSFARLQVEQDQYPAMCNISVFIVVMDLVVLLVACIAAYKHFSKVL